MNKRWIGGLAGLMMALLILTSCSAATTTVDPTPSAVPSEQPEVTAVPDMEITLAMWDLQSPSDADGSTSQIIYDEILNRFGLRIVPWSVTWTDWKDRINTAAAEGSLPDFFVHDLYEDKIDMMMWSDAGIIRDIPEQMWTDYPALYRIMEWTSEYGTMPDGRMYYIPRTNLAFDQTGGQSTALYYRTDWAKSMGYSIDYEISWEQFISLLYDYSRGDPDGNESVDTRGLTLTGDGMGMLYEIFMMDFGVRDWVLQDGEWIPGLMSDRAKEALKWMNQLYRDGVIDPEYASQTTQDAYNKFASGQAAMLAADGQRVGARQLRTQYWDVYNPNTNIDDHVALLPQPQNPYGVSYNELNPEQTGTLVSAGVDDEKLSRSLALFDWLYTEEGLTFMQYGRQGVDYNMGDNGAVQLVNDDEGNPLTFSQRNLEMPTLTYLSTWNLEGLSKMEEQNTFDLSCQERLEDLWWMNNWQRAMFTDYMYTPEMVTFDLRPLAEEKLTYMMMMSTDIDTDWETYLAACMSEYNTQAAIDEVNTYAKKNDLRTEE